jgi:bifunctional non-homologous end joining protein LigD
MLLRRADKMVASPDWLFEPKWDGFRVLASMLDGAVRFISRNGHSFTHVFRPITDGLHGFPVSIVLDGEVICINDKGKPDFETLQARLRPGNGKLPGHLCYMVFDVLHVNGHSLIARPLEERQAALRALQPALHSDAVRLTEAFPPEKSAALLKACTKMGLEGVVMKRKGSVYHPGFRSLDWLKVPIRHREEFVVGGYLPSPRGYSTLILGQFNREGNYVAELQPIHRKSCPFRNVPDLRDEFRELPKILPQWVRPTLTVEVEYRQRLRDGLRHAALKGIRLDKRRRLVRRVALAERGLIA